MVAVMQRRVPLAFLSCLGALLGLVPARGAEMTGLGQVGQSSQGRLCHAAATAAEAALRVPDAFLSAIAKVESGRPDPATGIPAPWPWTVDAEGRGSFYASKAEAVAAVQALQARGVRSIDVGCLQVNLLQHPDAFASLDLAFDPSTNAMYAAGFLVALFHQTGNWPLAAAAYHSQTPTLGAPYERRVLAEWATPDALADPTRPRAHPARPPAARVAAADAGQAPAASVPAASHGPTLWAPVGRAPVMGETAFPGAHAPGQTGRSLAAYRLLPTRLAMRAGHAAF